MNFRRTLTTSWTKKMKMTRTEPKPMWKFVGHHRPLFRHWDWTRDIGELRPLFCEIRQVYLVRFTWIRLSFLGTVPVILRLTQASGFWGLVLASYSAHARFIGKVSQIFGDLFCPPSSHNVGDWNSIAMNGGRVGVCSLSPTPFFHLLHEKTFFSGITKTMKYEDSLYRILVLVWDKSFRVNAVNTFIAHRNTRKLLPSVQTPL